MGRKSKFKINEVIEMNTKEEDTDERIAKLRGLLADELKSDSPSTKYIEDLKESIGKFKNE